MSYIFQPLRVCEVFGPDVLVHLLPVLLQVGLSALNVSLELGSRHRHVLRQHFLCPGLNVETLSRPGDEVTPQLGDGATHGF